MKASTVAECSEPESRVENPGDLLDSEFPQWSSIRDMVITKFQKKKGYQPKQLIYVVLFILAAVRKGKTQFPLTFLKRFIDNNYSGGSERDLPLIMKILNEAFCKKLHLKEGAFSHLRRQGDDWVFSRELCDCLVLKKSETLEASNHESTESPNYRTGTPNPYINRKMIKNPSQFWGRHDELGRIFSRIEGSRPQCISVIGERRIGKSSLLWHVHHPEVYPHYLSSPEKYVCVFLDLQEHMAMTAEDFFTLFFQALCAVKTDINISEVHDYTAFKALAASFECTGQRLIILLDEFDKVTMNTNFGPDFFSFLRSMSNRYELAFITSSTRPLQQLCATEEIEDSPFFNIFTPLFLSVFKHTEALSFINEYPSNAGCRLDAWSEHLLSLGGYHPFFLQIACSVLYDALHSTGSNDIDWHQINETFLQEAGDHFLHFWGHMNHQEREVVKYVAQKEELPRKRLYVLEELKKKGIAYEFQGHHVFFSPVFAEFILRREENLAG
ncbi:MAG: TniB family NTP-binding protein [Candidatus Xenobiia bacterium LiM19]